MFPLILKTGRDVVAPASPVYYMLAQRGLYLVKQSSLFSTTTKVAGLPWLAPHDESYQLHLPKMPAAVLLRAWAFFRAVYRRYQSEAIVFWFFTESAEFELMAPPQEVSPLACFYEPGPTPEGWVRVGTIHSHGQIAATHSLVDEEDERYDDGIHVTLGNILGEPSIDCELAVGEMRFALHPSEVLDGLGSGVLAAPDPQDFPQEWLNNVRGVPARPQ